MPTPDWVGSTTVIRATSVTTHTEADIFRIEGTLAPRWRDELGTQRALQLLVRPGLLATPTGFVPALGPRLPEVQRAAARQANA